MKSTQWIRRISLTLALLSLASIVYVDVEILARYNRSGGKTQAMFAIIELTSYNYKYWILIPAIVSVFLSRTIIWRKEFNLWDIVTLILALAVITGTVTPSWRLFI